ncbi:hypothetical protein MOVS_04685 [Moraxella ovis]|uniref:Uncharacterized protein n=1 Tax=Moraxella ovis TaxID=29433 RepID=A0A378PJQ1_9GAMM|nr:hypothetical protein [Moraxella ovis]ANB91392.1 hypothetical protein MOVS_04685 [Moraxella ovis]STY86985.1 Uncharacterised protein [Moraxella ovis]
MNDITKNIPKNQTVMPSDDEQMLDEIKYEDDNFVPLSSPPDLTDDDEDSRLKVINESNTKKEIVVPVMPLV